MTTRSRWRDVLLPQIIQGTPEWHELRAEGIGASEVCALFGAHKDTYQASRWVLWQERARGVRVERPVSERARVGLFFEPALLAYHAAVEGWTLLPAVYAIDDANSRVRASLDGIIAGPCPNAVQAVPTASGPGVVDAKMAAGDQVRGPSSDWTFNPAEPDRPTPPFRFMLQLQQQMACTGYTWGALAACIAGTNFQVYYVRRNERLIEQIRDKIADFYASILLGEEPAIDGGDVAGAVVRQQYAGTPVSHLDLHRDPAFDEVCAQKDSWAAQRLEAEKQHALYDNRLRRMLGTYETAQGREWAASGKADKNGNRRYRVYRKEMERHAG